MKKYYPILYALCVFLTACSVKHDQETSTVVYVPSLRYYLPYIEKHAKEWATDSYLVRADVKIEALGYSTEMWRISTEFVAPSKIGNSFAVFVYPNDKYETMVFAHSRPLSVDRPILEQDWPLDSIDAFDILFTEDERAIFSIDPDNYLICSALVLRRHFAVDENVTWMLTSSTCGLNTHFIFLNPITGELFVPNW